MLFESIGKGSIKYRVNGLNLIYSERLPKNSFYSPNDNKNVDYGIIHNEYDILTKSGKDIEVKTARKRRKNNTFQFNGINPNYNYDFMICLGVCQEKLMYRILSKTNFQYIHKERNHYLIVEDLKKQLVRMNPDNQVNFKLTLKLNEMSDISNIIDDLKKKYRFEIASQTKINLYNLKFNKFLKILF